MTRDTLRYLKPRAFKIKPKEYVFESVKFMSADEKMKVYKNFITFLNNHFKRSSFNKRLYNHFHLHCGFIAHYNIHGYYDTYFGIGEKYHYTLNTFGKEEMITKEAFIGIYNRIGRNGEYESRYEGINGFFENWLDEQHMFYAIRGDYADLNAAIKEVILEYIEQWNTLIHETLAREDKELQKAKKAEAKEQKMKAKSITAKSKPKQGTLDLFGDAA